jgi:HEAT repeat protein
LVALGRIADPQAADSVRPFLKVSAQVGIRDENTDFEIAWAVRTHAARALARMGDLSGVPVLVELLEADQAMLRDHAQNLLEEITGQQLGPDPAAWHHWWDRHPKP